MAVEVDWTDALKVWNVLRRNFGVVCLNKVLELHKRATMSTFGTCI